MRHGRMREFVLYALTMALMISVFTVQSAAETYMHLGCYTDNPTDQGLNGNPSNTPNTTKNACAQYCIISGGYPYSGLQAGSKCSCGDAYNLKGASGASTGCTTCSDQNRCGGPAANDDFYNVDKDVVDRQPVGHTGSMSYVAARQACVKVRGDLIVPNSLPVIEKIVQLQASGFNVTSAWVGLRRRLPKSLLESVYEWTDENVLEKYSSNAFTFSTYWTDGDVQNDDCVSLVFSTKKWKSVACDTALPFVCNQPPATTPPDLSAGGVTTVTPASEDPASQSKRLALFIVLPLFLFCYGGSCILYCIHKIIKNCNRKRPAAKMTLDQMGGGPGREKRPMPYMDNPLPPKRPLSASRRVYPAPMDATAGLGLNLPTKAMPVYIPQNTNKVEHQLEQETPRPTSSSGIQVGLAPPAQLQPPPYADEKRARLLENAAREARERRAKEEAEGRPMSRPFSGAPKLDHPYEPPKPQSLKVEPPREPQSLKAESPREQASPSESTGSTANLLPVGKNDKKGGTKGGAGDDDDDKDDNGQMSINEILKKKVQDKKKPRKVVAS
jgi:hypothetical protein